MWLFVEQRFGSVNRRSRKARGKLPDWTARARSSTPESGAIRCVDELHPLDVRAWKGRLGFSKLSSRQKSPT